MADNPLQDFEGPHLSHAPRKLPDTSRQKLKKNTSDHLKFTDCSYDNPIARQEIWNSCGFKIPDSKTEQYKL